MRDGYRYYLVGFSPKHDADYEREWLAFARERQALDVEGYNPMAPGHTAPVPAFMGQPSAVAPIAVAPIAVAPIAVAPTATVTPPAPFPGGKVRAYLERWGENRGAIAGWACKDSDLPGVGWLLNNHPDMPGVWKTRTGGVWYSIDHRPHMLAAKAALEAPATPAPGIVMPFTTPAASKPRKPRKA